MSYTIRVLLVCVLSQAGTRYIWIIWLRLAIALRAYLMYNRPKWISGVDIHAGYFYTICHGLSDVYSWYAACSLALNQPLLLFGAIGDQKSLAFQD
jgi:hypothetical protein